MSTAVCCTICLAGVLLGERHASTITDADWPQFRGPGARGVREGASLPDAWSAQSNVAWKSSIPGRGWSSPVVTNNRVFLTTTVNLGKAEDPKKGLYFGGERLRPPDADHQWKVLCLDLPTGKKIWERQVHAAKPPSPIHIKNSFASETPVTDGQRVYCYFGNLGVFCFDLDGNQLWKQVAKPVRTRFGWGTAASPALHGERLYIVSDNEEDSFLLALDKCTGREVLRIARDEKSNWATPFVWENGARTEIVTAGTGKVRAYDTDGQLLWWLQGMSGITIATPYAANGLLYVSSGYVLDQRKPLYAIRPGAKGDISLAANESSNAAIAWCQKQAGPYNPTSLVYHDRLYVLYDRGTFACFDARTGERKFGPERIPNGHAFTSSPWAYGGKVFCLNEDGVTFVFRAADKFELLHANRLADDDMCMATPAIVRDRLLIRTAARLYCFRNLSRPE